MKLYIKQRIFSWGDRFSIYDETGRACYHVCGEVFSWGKKLHLYNEFEEEQAYIEQKLLSFLPRYRIYSQGVQRAEIIKHMTFLRDSYSVEGLAWSIEGDFCDHSYEVSGPDGCIVRVEKRWFTFGDAYELDISDGLDEIMAIAVVLVIDACMEND